MIIRKVFSFQEMRPSKLNRIDYVFYEALIKVAKKVNIRSSQERERLIIEEGRS